MTLDACESAINVDRVPGFPLTIQCIPQYLRRPLAGQLNTTHPSPAPPLAAYRFPLVGWYDLLCTLEQRTNADREQ